MSVEIEGFVWICGHCKKPTTETHFYEDRSTGLMAHLADPKARSAAKYRCGWRFDDDYGTHVRCRDVHGHTGLHRNGIIRWSSVSDGAIRPPQHQDGASRP
jgi:hypothetical protein